MGNGDGTFQAPVNTPMGFLAESLGDVNGDGIPDVVAVGDRRLRTVCKRSLGNADGTFQAAGGFLPRLQRVLQRPWCVGDFNGDGKPDLVAVSFNGTDGAGLLFLFREMGMELFPSPVVSTVIQSARLFRRRGRHQRGRQVGYRI